MIRKLAIAVATIAGIAFCFPVKANGIIWYQTSSDNGSLNFGDSTANRYAQIAQVVTVQATRSLCEVRAKIFRGASSAGIVKLTVYQQSWASYDPDSILNTILAQIGVAETSIPQDLGVYTQYTTFNLDTDGDGANCPVLQQNVTYAFVFTREPLTSGSYNLLFRTRSTDEFTYSNATEYCNGGACGFGWVSQYPRELAIQLVGQYADATMAGFWGVLGSLFIPTSTTIDRWDDEMNNLRLAVPWGYFFILRDEALELSTSTPSDLKFDFSLDGLSTSTMNVTDQYDLIPENVKDWAYAGALAFMAIELFVYVYDTIHRAV